MSTGRLPIPATSAKSWRRPLIPRKPGDRVKTDRRDAVTLACLHRAGELTPVWVLGPDQEAVRDLTRAREDMKAIEMKARQRLGAFLLRHGRSYFGKSRWTQAHFRWLEEQKFALPLQQLVFQEYVDAGVAAGSTSSSLRKGRCGGWGRTGCTFLHTSLTRPSHLPRSAVPDHLADSYADGINDATPEVLRNLEFLGIDVLVPIGGDDTLSYGGRLHEEEGPSRRDPEDDGQRCPRDGVLHRVQHLCDPDDRAREPAADVGGLVRAVPRRRGLRPASGVHGAGASDGGCGGPGA